MYILIPTCIVLYFLFAVMYRIEVGARGWRVALWPFFLVKDIYVVFSLYASTSKEIADAEDGLHPWHNKKVIVADTEKNKMSPYWCPLIGRQGKVIASFGEDLLTVWLDGEAVPNEQVLTERFALL